MGSYVIKEMPIGMGNGSEGKVFPKMQVYSEFDYDKVVELVNDYSPAFSPGTVRGVLDTLAVVMKSYLPMGHTLKIDNIGVFSLALEFVDNKTEAKEQQEDDEKKKYCHVRAKDVNFKVDKKLVEEINRENSFERTKGNPKKSTNMALLPYRNTLISTNSATVQHQENWQDSLLTPSQASKPKAQARTKSG